MNVATMSLPVLSENNAAQWVRESGWPDYYRSGGSFDVSLWYGASLAHLQDETPLSNLWESGYRTTARAISIWNEAHNTNAGDREPVVDSVDAVEEELAPFVSMTTTKEEKLAKLRALIEDKASLSRALEISNEHRLIAYETYQERLSVAQAPISDASDDRLAPIWEKAHKAATEAGHCSVFDELMEEIGAPRRDRERRIRVSVDFVLYRTVSGSYGDDDDVSDELDMDDLIESARDEAWTAVIDD